MATRGKNIKNNNKNYNDIIEEEKKNNCSALNSVDVVSPTNNLVEELNNFSDMMMTIWKI